MKKQFYFLFLLILTSFVLGCSKSDDGASSPDAELTDEQIEQVEQMFDAVTSIEDECNRLFALDLSEEELEESILEYIGLLDNVDNIEKEDDYNFKMTFNSGLESYLLIGNPMDINDEEIIESITFSVATLNSTNMQTRVSNNSDVILSSKVLIWNPFINEMRGYTKDGVYVDYSVATAVGNIFGNGNFTTTTIIGADCDIASLDSLTEYGIIILNTHGAGGTRFSTEEKYSPVIGIANNILNLLYKKSIGLTVHIRCKNGYVGCYYSITPDYIENKITGTFPNSLIFNGSCESTKSNSLWSAFEAKGAKAYLGFDKGVPKSFCAAKAREYFYNMFNDDSFTTVSDSYNEIINCDTTYVNTKKESITVTFQYLPSNSSLIFEKIEEEPESSTDDSMTLSLSWEDGGLNSWYLSEPGGGNIQEFSNKSNYGGVLNVDDINKIAVFNWPTQLPIGSGWLRFFFTPPITASTTEKFKFTLTISTHADSQVYTYEGTYGTMYSPSFTISEDGSITIGS